MKRFTPLLVVLLLAFSISAAGQKTYLTPDKYDSWENLGSFSLSDDGNWIAYHVSLVDGDDTLHIKSLTGNKEYKFPLSSSAEFSSDSKWITMRITLSREAEEKLREQKKDVRLQQRLINLNTGEARVFDDIERATFTKDAKHLVMAGYNDKESKTKDINLLNLSNGKMKNIGNVLEFGVNKTGNRLAYITETGGKNGRGVELFNLENYSLKVIDSDSTAYSNLAWEKEGGAFTFLKSFEDTAHVEKNHILFSVRNALSSPEVKSFNPMVGNLIPEGMRIRETFTPRYSKDMTLLYFGVYNWTPKEEKEKLKKDKEKLPGVDIWHWKDHTIQPRQQLTYQREEANFTYLYAWNTVTGKLVRISDDDLRDPRISDDGKSVLVRSDKNYRPQFRTPVYDHYLINPITGEKSTVILDFGNLFGFSPGSKYIYYFKDKAWWVYDIAAGKHNDLTSSIGVDFWNTRDDRPNDIKPPFGPGGWFEKDQALMVYDEYDVWKIFPDGSKPVRLTAGREDEIIYRVDRIDNEEDYFSSSEDIYLSAFGDKSKWSGVARISPKGKFTSLVYNESAISSLVKAKSSDRFAFREETYSDSPDLFVSGYDFRNPVQLSATNPQQDNYYWGRSELVEYTNRDGKKLQGALYYPANYEEGKKYPMIVYIYEIRSTGVHRYTSPSTRSAYNTTNYTSSGYFIFQPDIVYKTNHPGESAVDCVVPAVEEVLKTGMIDPGKIGLMGHSWGAYQTSFIITQTDLFSAAVAGAPLIDMISMYNEIYWNSGSPNQNIFETSQGRLREPWWDIMDNYIDNSPMFQAGNIKTPLLVAFGNNDGAVDWHQGIEMFTTMRRMEKPYIMLVYDGENHGLRKRENTLDYCIKTRQFFEHHLLGKEAEEWISRGKTYLEKKSEENLKNSK